MSKAVLFSTSTRSWCRRAKRYFTEHRVPFKEIDVERDPKEARDVARKTGQTGVPVIKTGNRWRRVRQAASREGASAKAQRCWRSCDPNPRPSA